MTGNWVISIPALPDYPAIQTDAHDPSDAIRGYWATIPAELIEHFDLSPANIVLAHSPMLLIDRLTGRRYQYEAVKPPAEYIREVLDRNPGDFIIRWGSEDD